MCDVFFFLLFLAEFLAEKSADNNKLYILKENPENLRKTMRPTMRLVRQNLCVPEILLNYRKSH